MSKFEVGDVVTHRFHPQMYGRVIQVKPELDLDNVHTLYFYMIKWHNRGDYRTTEVETALLPEPPLEIPL